MSRGRTRLLLVLMTVVAFSNVDGLATGLVLQDIKIDLGLRDWQLGLLTGIAFALFYALVGIPLARWADRGNRARIISLCAITWSVMVALCGFAANFMQLLLIRVGVAVGESGCIPTANSLIAEHFDRSERPRATAISMLGGPLSVLIGYFIAGWLAEFYGWRRMFQILGAAGLIPALVASVTLRDPRGPMQATIQPTLREVMAQLCRQSVFRHLLLYYSVTAFFAAGVLQWQPAFFVRSFSLTTGQLGTYFALIYGAGGAIGTYLGGAVASRGAAGDESLQFRVAAVLVASLSVVFAVVYLASNELVSLGLMAVGTVAITLTTGPIFAAIQSLVPEQMRAVSIAVVLLCANLVGGGLGPLLAGALSDALHPMFGNESLRYALLALCPGYLWSAWHLWKAGQAIAADEASV